VVSLEVNPRHSLVRKLSSAVESNPEQATLVAHQILDNALMAAGLLEDPKDMVSRVYRIMDAAL
ncbi:MAG: molecular chaperone HtpG, partial [Verrucomicrobiota bacterium]